MRSHVYYKNYKNIVSWLTFSVQLENLNSRKILCKLDLRRKRFLTKTIQFYTEVLNIQVVDLIKKTIIY